jgi:hypothetical protein
MHCDSTRKGNKTREKHELIKYEPYLTKKNNFGTQVVILKGICKDCESRLNLILSKSAYTITNEN